ncbi:hypothetical protein GF352_05105, partial [archaeon]|nr:hypothetical protein [archaeon]
MNLKDRADAIYEGIVNGLTNHESLNQEKIKLVNYIKEINFFNIIDDKPINYLELLDTVKLIISQYTRDFNNSPLEQIRIIKNNFLTKEKDNAYKTKDVMKEFKGYFKNFFDEQLLDEILKKEGGDGLPYGVGEKISDKTINQMSNYSIINLEGINGFEKEFKNYLKDLKTDYITKHTLLQQEFDKLTREGKITDEIKILNNNERQRINDLIQYIDVILEKINNEEAVNRYDIIDIEESFMKNLINKLVPIIYDKKGEEYLGLLNKNTELITEEAVEKFETSANKKDELGKIGQRKIPEDPQYLIAKFQAYSSGLFIKGKELCKGFSKRDKKTINTFAELDGISSEWLMADDSKNYIDKHHKPSLYALSTNFLLTIPEYFKILEKEPVSIEKKSTPSPKRTARIIEDAFKPFLKNIISMKKEGAPAFLHESENAYSLISSVDMDGFSKLFNEGWIRLRDSITRTETKEGFKWDLEGIKNKYKTLFKEVISMRGFKIDDNFSNIKLPGIKISFNEEEFSLKNFEAKNDELARIKSFFEDRKGGVIDKDLIKELVDTLEVNKYKAINQELLDQLDGYLDRVQLLYGVPKDYRYLFLERELENGCLTELNDFTATKLYESTNIKFDKKKIKELERNKSIIQQIDENDYGKMLERINILDTTLNKKILEGMSLKVSVKEEERAVRIRELFKDLLISNTKQEFIRKRLVNKARLN